MAEFSLNEEQMLVQDTMRDFAKEELRTIARICDEENTLSDEVLQKIWELGICATSIPEQYGGYEMTKSAVTSSVVAEELAYGDLSLTLGALSPQLMVVPLLEYGTAEQKQQWLPKFCDEKFYPATAALMEPRVTFDPFQLQSRAIQDGNKVIINGRKCMVPLADRAAQILVYCARKASDSETIIDAYIVDKDSPGLQIGECEKNLGLRGLPLFPVTFDNCEVSIDRRVGGDKGIDYTHLLNLSRTMLGAMAIGVSRASYDYALEYAKERKAFGDPIATRQSIAFLLAEAAIEIDAMRMLVWRTAWELDNTKDAIRSATLTRHYCAEQTMKIVDAGVQILGGHGYIREHPVEMWFRNGRAFGILEGLAIA